MNHICVVSTCNRKSCANSGYCFWHTLLHLFRYSTNENKICNEINSSRDYCNAFKRYNQLNRVSNRNISIALEEKYSILDTASKYLIDQWKLSGGSHSWRRPGKDESGLYESSHSFNCAWREMNKRLCQSNKNKSPFQCCCVRREQCDEKALDFFEEQEKRNLPVFLNYYSQLRDFKTEQPGRVACGGKKLFGLFRDKKLNQDIQDHIVYHHIGKRNIINGLDAVVNDSFARHQNVKTGDILHYSHVRSCTLLSEGLESLGNVPVIGLEDMPDDDNAFMQKENAIVLEMLPKHGIYVGEATCKRLQVTHVGGEKEVIVPADTYWKVVNVCDACFPKTTTIIAKTRRIRAIQMQEIDKPANGTSFTEMTLPFRCAKAQIYLP